MHDLYAQGLIIIMSTIYCGIDVSTRENTVCCIDSQGKTIDSIKSFPQKQSGAKILEKWIKQCVDAAKASHLLIATEATSFYDLPILDFLAESRVLAEFNPSLYRFNAKFVKRFRQSMGEREKTDLEDSRIIAEKLRAGLLPHAYLSHQKTLPLQRLTRYRVHLIRTITREKQHLLSHVFLKHSTYKTDGPFKGQTFGATSRAVLEKFLTSENIADTSIKDLTEFVIKHGRNRSPRPKEIAKELKSMARESYRIRPSLAESINVIIASGLRTLRALHKTLKEVNQAITDELKAFPQTLESIKGIGPIYAAGILSEIGDVSRFSSSDKLAKYTGLWWPRIQSGKFEAQERRMRKAGNVYLRYYLVEAANSVKHHNSEYRKYYQKKYQEVNRHQHKRALVLTARKLVRLVYALLKRGELYKGEGSQASAS